MPYPKKDSLRKKDMHAAAPEAPSHAAQPAGRWDATMSAMADDLEGRSSAWKTRTGKPAAVYGQLVGTFGAKCNDDPNVVTATWARFVVEMKAEKLRDGRAVWAIIRKANVVEQAGRWLADNAGRGGASNVVVVQPMVMPRGE